MDDSVDTEAGRVDPPASTPGLGLQLMLHFDDHAKLSPRLCLLFYDII
jgi:hypothetical protein